MKKFLPLTLVPVAAAFACTPDIAQDTPADTTSSIEVLFDPAAAVPVVPAPNDLAKDRTTGKLAVPDAPGASDAQKEFNAYLNTLDNFPFESTASVTTSGDLDPATVTAANVIVIDVTNGAAPATGYTPSFANKTISIAPPKGGWTRGHQYAVALYAGDGGLKGAGGQAVHGSVTWALVSTDAPLVTCAANAPTNCRPTVDIIPSTEHDAEKRLADQTAKAQQLEQIRLGYKPVLDALTAQGKPRATIPIVWTFSIADAAEVLFDPADSIIPFPNNVLLDATDPAKKHIKLPNPKTFQPLTDADCAKPADQTTALVCGLNTLDGFSTTVPPQSENSNDLGALQQGEIDPASLSQASVGLAQLGQDKATSKTDPNWQPCINCATSKKDAPLQTLQWNLLAPLDERSTYLAYVTTDVKDTQQKNVISNPVFALARSKASLLTADGHSAVSIISDDQAKQLEPLRAGMAPALDALAAKGLTRDKIALAFAFSTQSEGSVLDQLRQVPAGAIAKGLPDYPVAFGDTTLVYTAAATAAGIPITNIGKFFSGVFYAPVSITGPSGTLNPTAPKLLPIPFVMSIPDSTNIPQPAGGYPITIFGHGLTRSRNDFLPIANSLATAGQIVIAIDGLDHGDRTTCAGSTATVVAALAAGGGNTAGVTDDYACNDPKTQKCDGDPVFSSCVLIDSTKRAACAPTATDPTGDFACAAQGQGRCAADGKCQGAVAPVTCTKDAPGNAKCASMGLGLCGGLDASPVCIGSPAQAWRDETGAARLSGYNLFNLSNFFATRDNFREQVIDLEMLMKVLKSTAATNLENQLKKGLASTTFKLDTAKINYAGQSLGSILGTLWNSVSPDTNNVALNVGGGALVKLFTDSPTLAPQKAALVEGLAATGVQEGTPQFDQVLGFAQWILDAADPANMAYRLTHPADGTPNADRKVLLQFIKEDQFVINASNFALVAGANRQFDPSKPPSFNCAAPLSCYEFIDSQDNFDLTSVPLEGRHGFLLKPPSATAGGRAVTSKAQFQIANFIATGTFLAAKP